LKIAAVSTNGSVKAVD